LTEGRLSERCACLTERGWDARPEKARLTPDTDGAALVTREEQRGGGIEVERVNGWAVSVELMHLLAGGDVVAMDDALRASGVEVPGLRVAGETKSLRERPQRGGVAIAVVFPFWTLSVRAGEQRLPVPGDHIFPSPESDQGGREGERESYWREDDLSRVALVQVAAINRKVVVDQGLGGAPLQVRDLMNIDVSKVCERDDNIRAWLILHSPHSGLLEPPLAQVTPETAPPLHYDHRGRSVVVFAMCILVPRVGGSATGY
jgi:hypothetical protein